MYIVKDQCYLNDRFKDVFQTFPPLTLVVRWSHLPPLGQ
jgi:hypothetical protein